MTKIKKYAIQNLLTNNIIEKFYDLEDAKRYIKNYNLFDGDYDIIDISQTEHIETKKEYDLTDDGTGKKYDKGKSMVGTLCGIFPRALLGIGRCIEKGVRKYPAVDNWKKVDDAFHRYQDAMIRHYLKFLSGEIRDSETNLPHLMHMAWNCLAILELYLVEHKDEYDKELFI